MTPPPRTPLGQLMRERMDALGIGSRSALYRRSGEFGGGVCIAQTTLKRWEDDPHIQPEHDQLVKLAHTLADTNSEHDRRTMIERVFAAAGQPAPVFDTLHINPHVLRRLGPEEFRTLERWAEDLARLRTANVREGRELGQVEPTAKSEGDRPRPVGNIPSSPTTTTVRSPRKRPASEPAPGQRRAQ